MSTTDISYPRRWAARFAVAAAALFALAPTAAIGADRHSALRDSLPQQWQYAPAFESVSPDDDPWWKSLGDPVLDSLISAGVENNFDVFTAIQRVASAHAQLASARSGYYPTVSVDAGWSRERQSGLTAGPDGRATTLSYFTAGASASWEIDLFGRITAQVNQSKKSLQASRADFDATLVSVSAEIATAYIQLRVWQAQLIVANEHVKSQHRVMDIAEARHEAGLASQLDVAQAQTVYYSTLATIPSLENSVNTAINSLATLLGIYADQLPASVSQPAPLPDGHMIVGVGIPADLLRRRPDLVAAEKRLAAAAAAVGVARKEFMPTLAINGTISTAAHRADDLFKRQSFGYSVEPTLSWTLFSGFSRRAAVASARAQFEEEWATYNTTVMAAVTDVDNSMSDYLTSLKNEEALERVVAASNQALSLSTDLYKSGNTSFTNVADAQVNFLQYTNSLISARGSVLTALIGLYKSLGGGWTPN